MAVSIITLKEDIKNAFIAEKDKTDNQPESIDKIADAIAKAVAAQIVQGINTTVVLPVLASPAGPVSGSITLQAS
jgi:AmiR/NasT family two-component response regulator